MMGRRSERIHTQRGAWELVQRSTGPASGVAAAFCGMVHAFGTFAGHPRLGTALAGTKQLTD